MKTSTTETAAMVAITDGAGKFLGRLSMGSKLSWVGPAHAACMSREAADRLVVEHAGASIVPIPKWDAAAKAYK